MSDSTGAPAGTAPGTAPAAAASGLGAPASDGSAAPAKQWAPGDAGVADDGTHFVVYAGLVHAGGDRNWRNNNPGNLEGGSFADGHGSLGDDGRFAIFPSHQAGYDALIALLQIPAYQEGTLEDAMNRYAPMTENDTGSYVSFLVSHVGLAPDTPMKDLSSSQIDAMATAISDFEGGHPGQTYGPGSSDPPWVQQIFASIS